MILSGETAMHGMLQRCFGSIAFACLVATPGLAARADLPLVFSPRMKSCLGDTCFIGRDGRLKAIGADGRLSVDCGPAVAVAFIERDGADRKALHVILPSRASRERGVRIVIGQGQLVERPYMNCFASGCTAEYEAGPELIDLLKRSSGMSVEAIDNANSPINLTIPLAGFADAYEGPSQETKVYEKVYPSKEEMQAEMEREKRAEEERKAWCERR
jgi:hypothetical protein